jgi:tetratricopeptide (TPR) repeat protein
LIITSRRRELVQSTPVPLKDLDQIEAITFLRRKGWGKLRAKAIHDATDKVLWETIQDMDRRPIVLEAFVNALSNPSTSTLAAAKEKVVGMLRKDLGEFLFADAWARFNQDIRALLLLMARTADVHDAQLLRFGCEASGVSIQAAEAAFDESGGIASTMVTDDGLQVAFSKSFLKFAQNKTVSRDGREWPRGGDVKAVLNRYSAFLKNASRFSGDRVLEAFRTPIAKAAHRARREGNLEEAKVLFEQALLADATNGLLFDRYAYTLLHDYRDCDEALHHAKRAVALAADDGEVWLTKGSIEARQGDLRAAEASLNKAAELGIAEDRVLVQRCWAYLKADPAQLGLARQALGRLKLLAVSGGGALRSTGEINTISARLDYLERHGRRVVGRREFK